MGRCRLYVVLVLVATGLAGGCDNFPGEPPEPPTPPGRQTVILRVEVTPDPVPAGDTATFRVVIRDSLDDQFRFSWFFSAGGPAAAETNTNSVRWRAPLIPGSYGLSVMATNGEGGTAAIKATSVAVVE